MKLQTITVRHKEKGNKINPKPRSYLNSGLDPR